MNEGDSEKELPASDRKLRRLREEGQVAQSRELSSAAAAVGVVFLAAIAGAGSMTQWVERTRSLWRRAASGRLDVDDVHCALASAFSWSIDVSAPYLIAAMALGVVVQFVQVGFLLVPKLLAPRLERLDPFRGFKEKFFSAKGAIETLKSLLKIAIVAGIAWELLEAVVPKVTRAGPFRLDLVVNLAADATIRMAAWCAAALFFLGAADLALQRFMFLRTHRMSREEAKREHRQDEGDPLMRMRREQARNEMRAELAAAAMIREVPDVVIVNPTHVACALRVDEKSGTPKIVASGIGIVAERIREVAKAQRVPIKKDIRLARRLVKTERGCTIPPDLLDAVIAVYSWVIARESRRGRQPAFLDRIAGQRRDSKESRNGPVARMEHPSSRN